MREVLTLSILAKFSLQQAVEEASKTGEAPTNGTWNIALIVFLACLLWLGMLVDCLQRAPSTGNDKVVWVLVIIFLGPLGAILYLLLQRSKWNRP